MTQTQHFFKRTFDVAMSAFGLVVFGWLIALCWVIAAIDTRKNGFFIQERVGRAGRLFRVLKIRTMRDVAGNTTTVTTERDKRITASGAILRGWKLDELPQLINVLRGEMSFVGPRPDVPGFADELEGDDRIVLSLRPGITGPATLAFRNEESLLAECEDPERFNREVVFPAKAAINRRYAENYSFSRDLLLVVATVIPPLGARVIPEFRVGPEVSEPGSPDEVSSGATIVIAGSVEGDKC